MTTENTYVPTDAKTPACRACQRERNRKSRAKTAAGRKPPSPRPCAWCGEIFTPKRIDTARFHHSNCARSQRTHDRRQRAIARWEEHRQQIKPLP